MLKVMCEQVKEKEKKKKTEIFCCCCCLCFHLNGPRISDRKIDSNENNTKSLIKQYL